MKFRHRLHDLPRMVGAFLRLFVVGFLLWALCTGLTPEDAGPGVVSAALFALSATAILPPRFSARIRALPGFALYFAFQSLRSGLHVAGLAMNPRMELHPGWIRMSSRLPQGPARAVFANLVGLLPGTLCAELHGEFHEIHLLHHDEDPLPELRELERQVAVLFGLDPVRRDPREAP